MAQAGQGPGTEEDAAAGAAAGGALNGRAPVTARAVLEAAVAAISEAGCETPQRDAEILVADALGFGGALPTMDGAGPALELETAIDPAMAVSADVASLIEERVQRRVKREPVAYILGRCGFRQIELAVDERVLIPRKETELLVEVALDLPEGARVHEVGTGSGAVALALLEARPDLRVTASDLSAEAAEVARANAERLGLPLEVSVTKGLPDDLSGGCDMVLANLPYITETTLPLRSAEIHFEPDVAVVGAAGVDGLGVIRELLEDTPAGWRIGLEHDTHHGPTVRDLLTDATTHRDYAGDERVTVGLVR